jgi:methyl-galactoside transport system substrate-binding protein
MKRIAFAFLSASLLAASALCLLSCEGSSGKPRIGVALYSVDDGYVAAARRALETEASGKARLSVLDGQNQQKIQSEQIEAMFADKAGAVIVNPVDGGVMGSLVFKAKSANVPIVLFSRSAAALPVILWDKAYFVGVREEEADELQIQILAEYWKANPAADRNDDKLVQYVVLRGDADHASAVASQESRNKAFAEAGLEGFKITEANAQWSRLEAQQRMADMIKNAGAKSIEAVLCENDEMALGAIEALKMAGLIKGPEDGVPVIGVDGTRFALEAIAEGSLYGTVRGDAASQGRAAFDLAYALARGLDPSAVGWSLTSGKYVFVPYQKVTAANYKSFM